MVATAEGGEEGWPVHPHLDTPASLCSFYGDGG